jgi:hypothetical protein
MWGWGCVEKFWNYDRARGSNHCAQLFLKKNYYLSMYAIACPAANSMTTSLTEFRSHCTSGWEEFPNNINADAVFTTAKCEINFLKQLKKVEANYKRLTSKYHCCHKCLRFVLVPRNQQSKPSYRRNT